MFTREAGNTTLQMKVDGELLHELNFEVVEP